MNRIEMEEAINASALKLWEKSYKVSENDMNAAAVVGNYIDENIVPAQDFELNDLEKRNVWVRLQAATKWLHCGRVTLTCGHKFAAALMASDASNDNVTDLQTHWQAFRVNIPDGLLENELSIIHYAQITVYPTMPEYGAILSLIGTRKDNDSEINVDIIAKDIASLLFSKAGTLSLDVDGGTVDPNGFSMRCADMVRKLTVGLLTTIQFTNNFKQKTFHSKNKSTPRDGPPPHRLYFVGSPIKIDCRDEIARFVTGKRRTAPSVQTLVRGHYRQQVIGIGRTGRKVIWIQPFWRGPDEAPILTRAKYVGA